MKYSYIKHRHKTVLTPEMQFVLAFFTITLFMLSFTYFYLLYKDYRFNKDKQELQQKEIMLNKNIKELKAKIVFIQKQSVLAESVHTKNMVLKDSITNLFDLVPQRITLSKASLLKNGLVLYGITPNKDVYNFMLQAPLRSIFHRTYTNFYPAKNGWLRFKSTNYIDKKDAMELKDDN